MPLTKAKPSKPQRVRGKSEIDDLFFRLLSLYQPGPFPPLSLPMFKDAKAPVLIFPTVQIAQARVWRNLAGPSSEELTAAIDAVSVRGLDREQVCFLIGLCEALFRPLRAVELALEKLFPDFLFSRHATWPPSRVARDLLASDFRRLWKDEEKTYGSGWVLAAGGVPLCVQHRPALFAPWVAGIVVERWLKIKGASECEGSELASRLIAVLLGREIRLEELRHWAALLETVLVPTDHGKALLPGYLAEPMVRLNSPIWSDQFTPTVLLELASFDREACEQFSKILQRAWKEPKQPKKGLPAHLRRVRQAATSAEPEVGFLFPPCLRCKHMVKPESIYEHLDEAHGIDKSLVEAFPNRRELRLIGTGEVLYRWSES